MAAALEQDLGVKAELKTGHSGIFEIAVDGKVVAARSARGFPTEQQAVDAVRAALGT